VVVEELLQFLIGEVDAQLLKGVNLQVWREGGIEGTREGGIEGTREGGIEGGREVCSIIIYEGAKMRRSRSSTCQYNEFVLSTLKKCFVACVRYTWKISNPAMSSTPMKKFLRAYTKKTAINITLCSSITTMQYAVGILIP